MFWFVSLVKIINIMVQYITLSTIRTFAHLTLTKLSDGSKMYETILIFCACCRNNMRERG